MIRMLNRNKPVNQSAIIFKDVWTRRLDRDKEIEKAYISDHPNVFF